MLKEWTNFLLDSVSLSVLCAAGGMAVIGLIGGVHWMCWVRPRTQPTGDMKAVVLDSYDGFQSIRVVNNLPVPRITDEDEVLIQVMAAGVDPIDVKMSHGYGRNIRSHLRRFNQHGDGEFPVILGRECSGVVTDVGSNVSTLAKGDLVWAFSSYCHEGLMAEFVVVKENQVARKPRNLTFEQAASLPYAAMITWNALANQCQLQPYCANGKRVLVQPGNTACGVLAVQLVKAWGGHVTTTVPTYGLPMSHVLEADDVIVYSVTDFKNELLKRKKFDVVLNMAGTILHHFCMDVCSPGGRVITLVSTPILSDKFGICVGSLLALLLQAYVWIRKVQHGFLNQFWWENFSFDTKALNMVSALVKEGKVQPVVEEVYPVENAVAAFRNVAKYDTIGRTVVTFRYSYVYT